LGLAIVKKIVEEHQGRIQIANVEGGGARITLMLPVNEES
jgi:signal transduction histidine kinase